MIKLETMPHTGKTAVIKGSFSCEGFLKASFQPENKHFYLIFKEINLEGNIHLNHRETS